MPRGLLDIRIRTVEPLDQEREEFDLRFVKYLVNRTRLPILGICGGLQLLNIHFGGSLIQDIESDYPGLGENHRSEIKQPGGKPVQLDYNLPGNPPSNVKRVLDELVELPNGTYLGKAHLKLYWGEWKTVAYFTLAQDNS